MSNPYLYLKEECEICKGKGQIFHLDSDPDKEYARQCECVKKMVKYMKLTEANVSEEYFDLTMKDFRPNDPQAEPLKIRINGIIDNIHTFVREAHNLLLYGNNGTGKTMLSIEILKAAMNKNFSIYYEFYPVVYETFIRKGYEADAEKDRLDGIFANVDVLVLDEIGKEKCTAFTIENSANLLEMHIMKKRVHKKTILISNNDPNTLNNTYNSTISSLLSQRYRPIHVDGTDFRGMK